LKIKRESTYRNTQQETDKWIGIVKLNREKDTLNLVKKDKDNAASINFFPSTPISQLQHKIEGKLQQMSVSSQKSVMKQ
jgi:U3 small nucleolar RNA-associated protein 14